MTNYSAPIRDMKFAMQELAGMEEVIRLPGYEEVSNELVDQVLEGAGTFAAEVWGPLNVPGDTEGLKWHEDGSVTTPKGFIEAYGKFVESGWNGLRFDPEYGGQGLPKLVDTAVMEMWNASNMAFSMAPLLTQGAIEAVFLRGSDEQKQRFLHKMVSGEWTGTMNLTEPQAGSDLGLIRTKAVPEGEHFRIHGQKIFISFGEHDLTENIVHLVLARTPTAPEGVRGISLFVVPKFLVNDDGSLGARNDVRCVSIEHKMGIHASPTAVLAFGDGPGAIGYLIGEENRGLEYMFIMMNEARFGVGVQGLGVAERAYQQALANAKERVQGKDATAPKGPSVPIIRHPDVRRMLMSMKSRVEAMRALAYVVAAMFDQAHRAGDEAARSAAHAGVDLLIPILKGWCTETGIEVASTGIQVHGGMGFIEETGAAQHLRDARITTIYEGTTGIQANDLIGRKVLRDGGRSMQALLAQIDGVCAQLEAGDDAQLHAIGARLREGSKSLADSMRWILATGGQDLNAVLAGAVPFLHLCGVVCGGWQMARAALAAQRKLAADSGDADFYRAKIATARFFADQDLSRARGLAEATMHAGASTMALGEDQF
ncbi:acyl-CoA dehydrogenase C-terminal domain-containing protein [Diaphorobacter limosus]|uniref:Acyl-CoA dehydrogenase C-terminal domain-containing protein n=1 Tax=Diaphorobacter limosus TaxID=3036128 RepID=A0ABZ0J3U4_9BURK|nr:acyl-CoA dehydrogenase C-terminal domain-containing protein [Diaphorobacter sp. Y-1]WOO31533.1 acyl-CoA dehydrogenase C-terminal domain-containing protein [Diaphorobacter sp. Y-1]